MLSAFKNFIVTLLVAALVFGVAAYFATRFLTDTITGIFEQESDELDQILNPTTTAPAVTETNTPTPVPPENEPDPVAGDSFNMLFIVTDYQPDIFSDYLPTDADLAALSKQEEIPLGILSASYRRPRACAVLLVRADKERREFTVTVFPSLTRVLTASGNQTLDNLYNLYGRDYIVSKASAMTGLPIDYSLMINITEVSDVVAELGGFSMYISRDLYYNGSVSTSVRPTGEEEQLLPKLYSIGSNNVDGPGAVALLMNEEYASGADVAAHNSVLITMFTEIMNKLTAMEGAAATAFYEKLCEDALIDTNFSPTEFVDRLELIFAWRDETFHRTSLEYPGRFVPATPEETAYYEPNTPAGVALFRNYRRILTDNKAA